MVKPPAYWRSSKTWQNYIGRTGRVTAATMVHVAAPELSAFAPYSYVIVDLGDEKIECMGASSQTFVAGDTVRCVLRKLAVTTPEQLIPYGIKVEKVTHA